MLKQFKPVFLYIIIDMLLLILSFYVVLDWFPLSTHSPFIKYSIPSLCYMLTWLVCSLFMQRYKPFHLQQYSGAILKLFYTTLFGFLLYWALLHFFFKPYSGFVLLTISGGAFLVNYIYLSIVFAYKFAVEYNEFSYEQPTERVNAVVKPAEPLDEDSYNHVCEIIRQHSGEKVLEYLSQTVDLKSGNTRVYVRTDLDNLITNQAYKYSVIIQLERLNNMRGINRKMSVINEKLPDNGLFICCFESKSTRKKRLLHKYPFGLNIVVYTLDFLLKRVMPKILVTRNIYYLVTGGKNRIFSKTEVLGRLYCLGYKVRHEKKIGKLTYVIAERIKQPEPSQKRIYGPLIRLRRFGRNAVPFEVYKMRTMHPYSEYLQGYIYERNSLKEGGKFNRDIRVTTIGSIMRKYWLDELPMVFNLLKGEMKLVGVRPLSAHYFSLYTKELQTQRVKYKPGLLPPFYADMPKTLDDIQRSEMNYLNACEKNGVFVTDIRYFFRILNNILFKKARSA